jgi:hypothetical protein
VYPILIVLSYDESLFLIEVAFLIVKLELIRSSFKLFYILIFLDGFLFLQKARSKWNVALSGNEWEVKKG